MTRIVRFTLIFLCIGCVCPLYARGQKILYDILNTDSLEVRKETMTYTVFVPVSGRGYVIMSKNDSHDIIGYSIESFWDEESFPVVLQEWLRTCGENKVKRQASLYGYLQDGVVERHSVYPLLTTHWHQTSPYNDYAPVIEDGNIKTVAGCVAIAAAQITYYWWRDNPDATQKNTPIYPYGDAPVIYSIPKGTPNEWELIKDDYNEKDSPESRAAAARLCYVLGTTSYLHYGSSTGGQINDAANAMYAQYNLSSEYVSKNMYDQQGWDELLFNELAHSRPVMCSGQGSGGHAFVLDGYDNETGLYHFNFGWGGSGDGYYPIDDSEYSMGGYRYSQSVVYNIHPKSRNIHAVLCVAEEYSTKIIIRIEVTNQSSLPAHLRLMCFGNNQNTQEICWESEVRNDGEYYQYNVELGWTQSQSPAYFYLYDENDVLLSELNFDSTSVENMGGEELGNPDKVFSLCGTQSKRLFNHRISVVKIGNTTKKILK